MEIFYSKSNGFCLYNSEEFGYWNPKTRNYEICASHCWRRTLPAAIRGAGISHNWTKIPLTFMG